MANIKVIVDGNEYSEEQYKRDLIRMFDSIRNEYRGFTNCDGVYCGDCPINTGIGDCNKLHRYEVIEIVYKWAKDHPEAKEKENGKENY